MINPDDIRIWHPFSESEISSSNLDSERLHLFKLGKFKKKNLKKLTEGPIHYCQILHQKFVEDNNNSANNKKKEKTIGLINKRFIQIFSLG